MRIQNIVVPFGAAALLFAACAPVAQTPIERRDIAVTNRQPDGEEGVVARVTVARCLREQTCGHVGVGQTYATRKACEDRLLEPTQVEVGNCVAYDSWTLDQCTQDIRALRCADPLLTVGVIDSCDMRRVCNKHTTSTPQP
jgi:hypothetical protein